MDLDEWESEMKGNQFETLVPIKILGNTLKYSLNSGTEVMVLS
jgi:hypothetical protein